MTDMDLHEMYSSRDNCREFNPVQLLCLYTNKLNKMSAKDVGVFCVSMCSFFV